MRSLEIIAKALDDGNPALAQIATLQLGLPELADGGANRMAATDRLLKAGYNPDEPRDPLGRWTTVGNARADARTQLAQNTQSSAVRSKTPRLVHVAGFPNSVPPFPKPRIRPADGYGAGDFRAKRDHGRREHLGVDLVAPPGTEVTSPVTGRVTGIFDPYGRDPDKRGNFSAVQITTDDGYRVRLMYVDPGDLEDGDYVEAGDSLGTVQDLSDLYPPKKTGRMTNHVHFDIQYQGAYLDPTPLVDAWQDAP